MEILFRLWRNRPYNTTTDSFFPAWLSMSALDGVVGCSLLSLPLISPPWGLQLFQFD